MVTEPNAAVCSLPELAKTASPGAAVEAVVA
jgi:hypothetical protein